MKINYIGGVLLRAESPRALASWYTEVLGFPLVHEHEGAWYGELETAAGELRFAVVPREPDEQGPGVGRMGLTFQVDDFDAALERLEALGIGVEELEDKALGRFVYVHDLEGNQLALWGARREEVAAAVPIGIAPMVEGELGEVLAIYNHYVLTSTCTFRLEEEPLEERRAWFSARTEAHPALVARVGGEVVGWGALSAWNGRAAYARTAELAIYVRHDRHRLGVGRALGEALIARAAAAGHRTVLGVACAEQASSLALQASLGFTEAGRLRAVGYKFGRWLDVVLMQRLLT